MADIDIQKKKKSPVGLWILGILALIALIFLIWWLMNRPEDRAAGIYEDRDTTEQDYVEHRDTTASARQSGRVAEFIAWTDTMNNSQDRQMGIHHEYTKNGLQKMAAALAAISERAENVNKDEFDKKLTKMRNMGDSITNNWESTQHANKIKRAFEAGVDVMKELQKSSFPNLQQDVNNVQQEVNKLDTKQQTLEQKDRVKSVFRKSADVIKRMDNNTAKRQSNEQQKR